MARDRYEDAIRKLYESRTPEEIVEGKISTLGNLAFIRSLQIGGIPDVLATWLAIGFSLVTAEERQEIHPGSIVVAKGGWDLMFMASGFAFEVARVIKNREEIERRMKDCEEGSLTHLALRQTGLDEDEADSISDRVEQMREETIDFLLEFMPPWEDYDYDES